MFRFNHIYFLIFLLLLSIEISIAVFLKTGFIRHTIGDVIVVPLIYCFVRSFVGLHKTKAALLVLLFAFAIELLQKFNLVEKLGLKDNHLAHIIIGNTFAWMDLLAYAVGFALILLVENLNLKS